MRWTRIAAVVALLLVAAIVAVLIALNTIDWSRYQDPVVARVKEATGRDLAVEGPLRLHIGLHPGVVVEGVRFQNAGWGTRPDMLEVERFEVQLALWPLLFRRIEVHRVVLSGAVIWLEVDEEGQGNWQFETAAAGPGPDEPREPAEGPVERPDDAPAESPAGTPPAEPGSGDAAETLALVHELVIERSQIVYSDARSGARQEVEIARLAMRMEDAASPLRMDSELAYNGEPIEAEAVVGGAGELLSGGAIDLDATVRAGGATITAKGPIAKPLEGRGFALDLSARGERLAALSGLAGSALPALGPYRVAASVRDGDDRYRIDPLEIEMGESRIRGSVVAAVAGPRPRIEARLDAPLLRAVDFGGADGTPASEGGPAGSAGTGSGGAGAGSPAAAGTAAESGGGSESDAPPRLFSSEPLPLEGLSAVDADVKLGIDLLELDGLALRAVELGLALDDRQLEIQPLRAELAGGALDGRVGLAGRQSPPGLQVKATLDRLDSSAVLEALGVTDALTGARVDGDIDVAGAGDSVAAIMASLDGDLDLEVGPGQIRREWAEARLGEWAPLVLGRRAEGEKKDTSALNCLVARFRSVDGLATSRGIAVDTPLVAVLGEGDIDFGTEEVDIALEPLVKEVDAGLVTPPAAVEGPLASPEFGIDRDAVVDKAVGIAAALAAGDSVAGGKDLRTSEGIEGCNELIAKARKLTGSGSSKKAEKKVKKELRKAKKKLRKEGLEELQKLLD